MRGGRGALWLPGPRVRVGGVHLKVGAHTCTFPFGPLKHESLAGCERRRLYRGLGAGGREDAETGEEGGGGFQLPLAWEPLCVSGNFLEGANN